MVGNGDWGLGRYGDGETGRNGEKLKIRIKFKMGGVDFGKVLPSFCPSVLRGELPEG